MSVWQIPVISSMRFVPESWGWLLDIKLFVMLAGVFLAAVALERRPSRARLAWLLAGVSLGGLVSCLLLAGFMKEFLALCHSTAGVLAKMGFSGSFVYPWCKLCAFTGVLLTGMAIGGGLGFWMKGEKSV